MENYNKKQLVKSVHMAKNRSEKGEEINVFVKDLKEEIQHRILPPLRVKVRPADIIQIIVGASILAIPVGFTEETWRTAETMPALNTILFFLISLTFISIFVYYNYYKHHLKAHWGEMIKRVIITYVFAFLVVSVLLTLIQVAPWMTETALALKMAIIVTYPASMSAAVADMIK